MSKPTFISPSTVVIPVGTVVKQAEHRIRKAWDDYRNHVGSHSATYRRAYEEAKAERGTVLEVLDGPYCLGYLVAWTRPDGRVMHSQCMAHMIEPARDDQ